MKNISTAFVKKIGGCFFVLDSAGTTECGMYPNYNIVSKPYSTEAGAQKFLAKYNAMTGKVAA
jgi:hypothetical protein